MNLTFQQAVVFLPLLTALITFFLTSFFSLYKDKKNNNFTKRIFFEYAEFELDYPKNFNDEINFGEGKILLGENGKKLHDKAELYGRATYTYLVLKNITDNNAINVKIKSSFSNQTKKHAATKNVTEEFFMPIWKCKDTLYIPVTFEDGPTHFSTNEELVITYNTTTFEKFQYSFVRQNDGSYKEQLKKRYLGFIWVPKIVYEKSNFYTFVNVKKKKEESKKEEEKKEVS